MKRFFIAALALVAVVGCSKDDEGTSVLETSKKSVSITIANALPAGRAVTTPAPASGAACTKAEDLVFGFVNGAGQVLTTLTIADATESGGVYTFHGLPQQVSEVFAIANGAAANKITKSNAPATLSAAHQMWRAQTPDVEWSEIIVFGHAAAHHSTDADGKELFCEVDGHKYPLYEASLTVTPNHARLEVGQVKCTDLGTLYSKLTLNSLVFAENLTQSLGANGVLLTPDANVANAGAGKVWSWNISKPENDNIYAPDLELHVTVEGNGWTVPAGTENRLVTVVDYAVPANYANAATNSMVENGKSVLKSFLPGEIYTLNMDFTESDIRTDMGNLCVAVNVTIANWVVVPVTPVFE